jgi:hypothetical protein
VKYALIRWNLHQADIEQMDFVEAGYSILRTGAVKVRLGS